MTQSENSDVSDFANLLHDGGAAQAFAEPWQAEVFAITVSLHEKGHFSWKEWADYLSNAIKDAQAEGDCDDGSTYFQHWLVALERLLGDKNIADKQTLTGLSLAWQDAATSTPHGKPIELIQK